MKKVFYGFILMVLSVMLCSCSFLSAKEPLELAQPESSIESILVVNLTDGVSGLSNVDGLDYAEIYDKEEFLYEFSQITFSSIPTSVPDMSAATRAIVIYYKNGDMEIITYYTQLVYNGGVLSETPDITQFEVRTKFCDESAFNNLIDKYI